MVDLCTFFDSRYLERGIALHGSLVKQGHPFRLWILCMDTDVQRRLSRRGLDSTNLVTIDDLAAHDKTLSTAKGNRSLVEFYFTSKPFLCRYIFAHAPQVTMLTYLDADLYFFSSPEEILNQMRGYSVGLTPHRFPPHLRKSEQYGRFNAGFISFRKDEEGQRCLDWWRERCLAWCHDYVQDDRFADQRYLDRIPGKFPGVRIIDHKGINAAPWNISQYRVESSGGSVLIDGDPLILYHFHAIQRMGPCFTETGLSGYQNRLSRLVRDAVYLPYLDVLQRQNEPEMRPTSSSSIRVARGKYDHLKQIVPLMWRLVMFVKGMWRGLRYQSLILYPVRKR